MFFLLFLVLHARNILGGRMDPRKLSGNLGKPTKPKKTHVYMQILKTLTKKTKKNTCLCVVTFNFCLKTCGFQKTGFGIQCFQLKNEATLHLSLWKRSAKSSSSHLALRFKSINYKVPSFCNWKPVNFNCCNLIH